MSKQAEAGQLEMVQILVVGLSAGAATALLCASIGSGALLASFLLYLSPLPIMIAALGWSHWAGLLAAVSATLGLATVLGPLALVSFLIGVGLPAWWLAYLALLARGTADGSRLEWYPTGRIVLWIAVLAVLSVSVGLLQIGVDQDGISNGLRKGVNEIIGTQTPGLILPSALTREERDGLLDLLVALLPPAAAVTLLAVNSFNLWLAGRIVLVSGRLLRPWPDIAATSLPIAAPVLLAFSVLGIFAPDFPGMVCAMLAATLLGAHAMVGLAVIHAVTAGTTARFLLLASMYGALAMLSFQTNWAPLLLVGIGMGETLFGIRGRLAPRIPPQQKP